jgi:carboxyl-terminal processing protease
VRLTIAKYFTPSGRSIQRPYNDNVADYYGDINKRYKDGEVFNQDSIKQEKKIAYKTLVKGRTVYGGGGITPDIYIPMDTSMYTPFVLEVYGAGMLQEFTYNYYMENKAAFSNYKNIAQFNSFTISDALYTQFVSYCLAHGVSKEAANSSEKSKAYLTNRLKAYFAKQLFKNDGYYNITAQDDKMIQRAVLELKK